jgi:hypothetical protein
VRGRVRDGAFAPDEVAWFIPYIWVDSAPGMADGREVFGFPKECADFVMPKHPEDAARFAVSTWVIPKYDPDSVCKLLPLLEVSRVDGGMEGALRASFLTVRDVANAVLSRVGSELFVGGPHLPLPTWALLRSILADLERGIVRTALLKQFRDCAVAGKACYQAIVETPCRTTKVRAAGFVDGVWRVRIHEYDSHPIVAEPRPRRRGARSAARLLGRLRLRRRGGPADRRAHRRERVMKASPACAAAVRACLWLSVIPWTRHPVVAARKILLPPTPHPASSTLSAAVIRADAARSSFCRRSASRSVCVVSSQCPMCMARLASRSQIQR